MSPPDSLTDNGIGIAPKHAERIFRPLGRLHTQDEIEGSGLGLAICERIIKLHGGTIKLDQSYNEGARFEIVLPAAALAVI
jgi:signal transduction histidine kinase